MGDFGLGFEGFGRLWRFGGRGEERGRREREGSYKK